MPKHFSIRLILQNDWISSLNNLAKAHMTSRLSLLRRYIHQGMIADLEEVKNGMEKLKSIEATKRELKARVKRHQGIKRSSMNEPLDF
jgi:hypothetical protein